jgi:uncharacterized protein (TIGR03086 family)
MGGMAPHSHDVDLEALESASPLLSEVVASIDDHHWELATPCDAWDLAALVDHVTGGNWFTILILNGQTAEEAMEQTMQLFDGRSATKQQAIAAVEGQLTAFRQPDVVHRRCHHVVGDLTGREVLRLRLHDLIVHTWDMSQTLEPPASVPAGLLSWATAELAGGESLTARNFEFAGLAALDAGDSEAAYLSWFGRSLSGAKHDGGQ